MKKVIYKYFIEAMDVTTGEVGSMVREAIKRGEQAISEEAKANGAVHQNAK